MIRCLKQNRPTYVNGRIRQVIELLAIGASVHQNMSNAIISLVPVRVHVVRSGAVKHIFIHARCRGILAALRQDVRLSGRVRCSGTLFVIVIRLLPIPVFENIGWIPLIAAMLLPCIRMDVSGTLCQKQGFVAHVIVQVTPLQTIPGVFPAVASPL